MSIRFRTLPDKNEYEVEPKNGLLMMCDILGFSNLVMSSECIDLSEKIVNIIDSLKIGTKIEYNKMLTEHPTLLEKLPNWSNKYELKYFLLSDTIIIYPNVDYEKTSNEYQISLNILTAVTKVLFNHLLTDLKLLIRGAIVDDEYCLVKEHPVIYGKAVIKAHQYEKCQNWGGIMLCPSISMNMKDSFVLDQSYKKYNEIPFKKSNLGECMELYDKHSVSIYVLKWVLDKYKIEWDEVEESTKMIMENGQLQDALKKIENTKRFYYQCIKDTHSLKPS